MGIAAGLEIRLIIRYAAQRLLANRVQSASDDDVASSYLVKELSVLR